MAGDINGRPIRSSDDRDWKIAAAKRINTLSNTVDTMAQRLGLQPNRGATRATGSSIGGGSVDSTARALAQQALTDLDRPRTAITVLGATGNGTMTTPEAFRIISMQAASITSNPRIRFYRSTADRTADAARPYTTAPPTDGSLIAEFRWTSAGTVWTSGFIASLIAGNTTLYYLVDGGTADITMIYVRED